MLNSIKTFYAVTYVCMYIYILCMHSSCWPLSYFLWLTLNEVKGKSKHPQGEADMYEGRGCWRSSCVLLSDNSLWLVALLSCDLFSPSRATGIWQNPSQDTFCSCVVRRDKDGDAVISGLDFSLGSTQLVSLFLSLFICPSICLSPGEGKNGRD